MKYSDLRDFMSQLQQTGELKEVAMPVSTHLEMTEVADRTLRAAGPALLFRNPTDAKGAVTQQARLSGPQGDLQADRIDVVLREGARQMDRLEAAGRVSLKVTGRTATGEKLTYADADGQYVMSGSGTTGIRIVDGCRETVGRTLILYKTSDRVIVDGNEEARTRTKSGSGAACAPVPAR